VSESYSHFLQTIIMRLWTNNTYIYTLPKKKQKKQYNLLCNKVMFSSFCKLPNFSSKLPGRKQHFEDIWLTREQLETIRVVAVLSKEIQRRTCIGTSSWITWDHWLKMLIPTAERDSAVSEAFAQNHTQMSACNLNISLLIIKKKFKTYLLMQTASLSKAVRAANPGKCWLYILTNQICRPTYKQC